MRGLPATYLSMSDTVLLEKLSMQDAFAFEAIYQRYADSLYFSAFKRLPVKHKAEDFVQEVFISLYRHRHEGIKHLRAWLFTCLRNLVLNEIRNFISHKKHDSLLALDLTRTAANQESYDLAILELQFHKALQLLTDRCREVFLMSRVENLSNQKIAQRLDISVRGVEKHVTTALRILKKELGQREAGYTILLFIFQLLAGH